jgi:hypothetical protein
MRASRQRPGVHLELPVSLSPSLPVVELLHLSPRHYTACRCLSTPASRCLDRSSPSSVVQSRAAAARKVFGKVPDAMEYLTRVLSSKVCDITIESSLCPSLSFSCLPSVRGYASKVNSHS